MEARGDMTQVAVLGASGMLGAMVTEVLSQKFQVTATMRSPDDRCQAQFPTVKWRALDVETADEAAVGAAISGASWVVNCIGIIKTYIHDDNAAEVERALRVNALFPHVLARAAARGG